LKDLRAETAAAMKSDGQWLTARWVFITRLRRAPSYYPASTSAKRRDARAPVKLQSLIGVRIYGQNRLSAFFRGTSLASCLGNYGLPGKGEAPRQERSWKGACRILRQGSVASRRDL